MLDSCICRFQQFNIYTLFIHDIHSFASWLNAVYCTRMKTLLYYLHENHFQAPKQTKKTSIYLAADFVSSHETIWNTVMCLNWALWLEVQRQKMHKFKIFNKVTVNMILPAYCMHKLCMDSDCTDQNCFCLCLCRNLTGRPTWNVAGILRRMAGSTSCGRFVAPMIITYNCKNYNVNT